MDLDKLFEPLTQTQLATLNPLVKDQLIESQARVIKDLYKENTLLKNAREDLKQQNLNLDEEYITVKSNVTDIKTGESAQEQKQNKKPKRRKQKIRLPSERYPEAEIVEKVVAYDAEPSCKCCSEKMSFVVVT